MLLTGCIIPDPIHFAGPEGLGGFPRSASGFLELLFGLSETASKAGAFGYVFLISLRTRQRSPELRALGTAVLWSFSDA